MLGPQNQISHFSELHNLSLPQNHLKENGQKLDSVNGSESMFHTHMAYYISSLKERKVRRNHICNKYAQTFCCEKYKWKAILNVKYEIYLFL